MRNVDKLRCHAERLSNHFTPFSQIARCLIVISITVHIHLIYRILYLLYNITKIYRKSVIYIICYLLHLSYPIFFIHNIYLIHILYLSCILYVSHIILYLTYK